MKTSRQIDRAAEKLAQAIRYQTIASANAEDMNPQAFRDLQRYLEDSYPRVHRLRRETIGNGTLICWPGSNPQLKPILLMAHMDVVPGGDESQWRHPPFEGVIRDGFVWGRGCLDMKGTLISQLEAVEALLSEGVKPQRTLYLAFGCDEELGGQAGAGRIADALHKRKIQLAYILDEGGIIVHSTLLGSDRPLALVGVVEKGRANVEIKATATPGHASMPGPHTAIGVLSREICRIEKNPFPPRITPVLRQFLRSLVPHARWKQRLLFNNLWLFRGLVQRVFSGNPRTDALIRTTQAVTIIQAGQKANVLPEEARAVVNVRLLPGDTLDTVQAHFRRVVRPDVQVTTDRTGVEPTDTAEVDAPGFRLIEQTLEQIMPQAVVLPYIMVGGTDSRHYSGLCANIYRFTPYTLSDQDLKGIHGTDERLSLDNLDRMIRFLTHFIRQGVSG